MKLRTQLALAFFLLAVLPLAVIVFYSYTSSLGAFRAAVAADSLTLAEDMEARLAQTREGIRSRVSLLGNLALAPAASGGETRLDPQSLARATEELGDSLPFVESLEFIPERAAGGEAAAEGVLFFLAPPPPAPPVPAVPAVPVLPEAAIAALATPEARRQIGEEARRAGELARRLIAERIGRLERETRVVARQQLARGDLEALEEAQASTRRLLGVELGSTITAPDLRVLGRLRPQVSARAVLHAILSGTRRDQGEVPFAVDADGALHTAAAGDAERLRGLSLLPAAEGGAPAAPHDWVVVSRQDPASGVRFGIARPIRASLTEIRRTAVRNFTFGLGLAALCFLGIFPISARITRNLETLTAGAERLASGDLETRVPIRSRDEFGRLAHTFNRMAEQLGLHERRLLEEARRREEQEVERALLAAENQRQAQELERAREFQLSLLPRELPVVEGFELAVHTATATEVGGDYYDFLSGPRGELTLAVGDATGHGAAAGTMVTVAKGLFHARAAEAPPAAFLGQANEVVRRMQLGRMAMALTVARLHGARLTVAAAGMPPVLVYRAAGRSVEELALHAPPLGALGHGAYGELETELAPGDVALLMTDGFPELPDESGEPLGYSRAQELFAAAAAQPPAALLADLQRAVDARRRERPLADDVTFVALRHAP